MGLSSPPKVKSTSHGHTGRTDEDSRRKKIRDGETHSVRRSSYNLDIGLADKTTIVAERATMAETTEGYRPQPQKKKKNRKGIKAAKPKMSKEERREKYTAIARNRRQSHVNKARDRHLVCYKCRVVGHSADNCPEKGGGGDSANSCCFKCGSVDHRLSACPQVKKFLKGNQRLDFTKLGALPYASCFVCNEKGHLSSSCPNNKNKGLYVNGGCCRTCGSQMHLAIDCPEKNKKHEDAPDKVGEGESGGADATIDEFLDEEDVCKVAPVEKKKQHSKRKGKIVNF